MSGQADALRLTQTSMVGGSNDIEIAEVTVNPVLASPEPAVITLTPPTRRRIAALNVASSTAWVWICRTVIVIWQPPPTGSTRSSTPALSGRFEPAGVNGGKEFGLAHDPHERFSERIPTKCKPKSMDRTISANKSSVSIDIMFIR